MTKDDEDLACCELYPRAYAWILKNIQKLENPFPVKGQQGIYEVEDSYIEANLKIEKKKEVHLVAYSLIKLPGRKGGTIYSQHTNNAEYLIVSSKAAIPKTKVPSATP